VLAGPPQAGDGTSAEAVPAKESNEVRRTRLAGEVWRCSAAHRSQVQVELAVAVAVRLVSVQIDGDSSSLYPETDTQSSVTSPSVWSAQSLLFRLHELCSIRRLWCTVVSV